MNELLIAGIDNSVLQFVIITSCGETWRYDIANLATEILRSIDGKLPPSDLKIQQAVETWFWVIYGRHRFTSGKSQCLNHSCLKKKQVNHHLVESSVIINFVGI